ncbi:MAG: hypothetical protein QM710_13745 [Flavobacterium sp.]
MRKKLLIGILLIAISYIGYRIFFRDTVENTFPFSKADNVELIFYKEAQEEGADLKRFSRVPIKKKVKLNDAEKEELFEILYKENSLFTDAAACYLPRHAFVFTTQKDTIGIIEVCLECSGVQVTKGIKPPQMFDNVVEKLGKFIKSKQ